MSVTRNETRRFFERLLHGNLEAHIFYSAPPALRILLILRGLNGLVLMAQEGHLDPALTSVNKPRSPNKTVSFLDATFFVGLAFQCFYAGADVRREIHNRNARPGRRTLI